MEEFMVKGLKVKIYVDDCPESPRKWNNVGTILTPKMHIGDRSCSVSEVAHIESRDDVLCVPLYVYRHGGTALSLSPFNCPWDSGQGGIIYAEHKDILFEYSAATVEEAEKCALKAFAAEINVLQSYINGDVYGYKIVRPTRCKCCSHEHEEELDSVWGIYGRDECVADATYAAEAIAEELTSDAPAGSIATLEEA
jgi:hypothetical protein